MHKTCQSISCHSISAALLIHLSQIQQKFKTMLILLLITDKIEIIPELLGALHVKLTVLGLLVQSIVSLPYFFGYKTVFSFQNNPKILHPSYKMDLDHWDCFGRVKLVLWQNFKELI